LSRSAGVSRAAASGIRFDDASHTITVPRPDGVTVTFVGEDVKIAGFHRVNMLSDIKKAVSGDFSRAASDTPFVQEAVYRVDGRSSCCKEAGSYTIP
jgi:hypothetical protein